MSDDGYNELDFVLPKGVIVFISGVPGVGKTTVSYELLRMFDEFRIVEETDLIRETLRGYNEYIQENFEGRELHFLDEIKISHNTKFLRYDEAKKQCAHMKKSLENIVGRQKRKGISTIINGVHIVPEVLDSIYEDDNIVFINLSLNSQQCLFERWKERESKKYNKRNLSISFQTNLALSESTKKLSKSLGVNIFDIDVTHLSIDQTKSKIVNLISFSLQNHQVLE